jgi:asparagine synthase (glutamine-hydrolysing)
MCGIICLIQYSGKSVDLGKAKECLNNLKPRGPDKQSYNTICVSDNINVFMGFARLAIMDTTDAGQQPFSDEKNYVVCNGEIYNYKALAKEYCFNMKTDCDCEILLPLFNKFGFENMVRDELDAEFAMIMLDNQQKKIHAARDRYGVRPLYYGYNNTTKTIGFASELKALHPIMEFVEQVKPNYIFNIDLSKDSNDMALLIMKQQYYSYKKLYANLCLDNTEYIHQQINNYFTEAVRKRLYADRPIGFLLSGGLDSSLIVAIATRILGPNNIVCFSIGIEGSPDVEAAKKVVDFLGIKNHHIIPFSINEGLLELPNVIRTIETYDITTIRASTPQYIMAKYIFEKTNIRVLLSGEGSDEIHGSYRYFRDAPDVAQFHSETIRLLEELYYFDNKRTDRTMAGNGLEVRVPFLDFEYVEFITRINPGLLMYSENYMEKQIVRDSFKNYLPNEILYRSKEAFSDAVSNSEINWAKSIQLVAEKEISDEELENNKFIINKPKTKDSLYFRKIFNLFYQNRDNIIPHYWLPRFQKEEILDPSARVLKCY